LINIKNQIEHLTGELVKLNKIINYFRQTELNKIDDHRKLLYEKSLATKKNIEQQLIELNETFQKLSSEMEISERASIKINNILYPGVKVTIGDSTVYIHQEYRHVILREKDRQIVFLPI
jgi:Protein of unknown function (DUF342).